MLRRAYSHHVVTLENSDEITHFKSHTSQYGVSRQSPREAENRIENVRGDTCAANGGLSPAMPPCPSQSHHAVSASCPDFSTSLSGAKSSSHGSMRLRDRYDNSRPEEVSMLEWHRLNRDCAENLSPLSNVHVSSELSAAAIPRNKTTPTHAGEAYGCSPVKQGFEDQCDGHSASSIAPFERHSSDLTPFRRVLQRRRAVSAELPPLSPAVASQQRLIPASEGHQPQHRRPTHYPHHSIQAKASSIDPPQHSPEDHASRHDDFRQVSHRRYAGNGVECDTSAALDVAPSRNSTIYQHQVGALEAVVKIQEQQLLSLTSAANKEEHPDVASLLPRWRMEALRQYELRLKAQLATKEAQDSFQQQQQELFDQIDELQTCLKVENARSDDLRLQLEETKQASKVSADAKAVIEFQMRKSVESCNAFMQYLSVMEGSLDDATDRVAKFSVRLGFAVERLQFATRLSATGRNHFSLSPRKQITASSSSNSMVVVCEQPACRLQPHTSTEDILAREIDTLRCDRDRLLESLTKVRANFTDQVSKQAEKALEHFQAEAQSQLESKLLAQKRSFCQSVASVDYRLRELVQNAVRQAIDSFSHWQLSVEERLCHLSARMSAVQPSITALKQWFKRQVAQVAALQQQNESLAAELRASALNHEYLGAAYDSVLNSSERQRVADAACIDALQQEIEKERSSARAAAVAAEAELQAANLREEAIRREAAETISGAAERENEVLKRAAELDRCKRQDEEEMKGKYTQLESSYKQRIAELEAEVHNKDSALQRARRERNAVLAALREAERMGVCAPCGGRVAVGGVSMMRMAHNSPMSDSFASVHKHRQASSPPVGSRDAFNSMPLPPYSGTPICSPDTSPGDHSRSWSAMQSDVGQIRGGLGHPEGRSLGVRASSRSWAELKSSMQSEKLAPLFGSSKSLATSRTWRRHRSSRRGLGERGANGERTWRGDRTWRSVASSAAFLRSEHGVLFSSEEEYPGQQSFDSDEYRMLRTCAPFDRQATGAEEAKTSNSEYSDAARAAGERPHQRKSGLGGSCLQGPLVSTSDGGLKAPHAVSAPDQTHPQTKESLVSASVPISTVPGEACCSPQGHQHHVTSHRLPNKDACDYEDSSESDMSSGWGSSHVVSRSRLRRSNTSTIVRPEAVPMLPLKPPAVSVGRSCVRGADHDGGEGVIVDCVTDHSALPNDNHSGSSFTDAAPDKVVADNTTLGSDLISRSDEWCQDSAMDKDRARNHSASLSVELNKDAKSDCDGSDFQAAKAPSHVPQSPAAEDQATGDTDKIANSELPTFESSHKALPPDCPGDQSHRDISITSDKVSPCNSPFSGGPPRHIFLDETASGVADSDCTTDMNCRDEADAGEAQGDECKTSGGAARASGTPAPLPQLACPPPMYPHSAQAAPAPLVSASSCPPPPTSLLNLTCQNLVPAHQSLPSGCRDSDGYTTQAVCAAHSTQTTFHRSKSSEAVSSPPQLESHPTSDSCEESGATGNHSRSKTLPNVVPLSYHTESVFNMLPNSVPPAQEPGTRPSPPLAPINIWHSVTRLAEPGASELVASPCNSGALASLDEPRQPSVGSPAAISIAHRSFPLMDSQHVYTPASSISNEQPVRPVPLPQHALQSSGSASGVLGFVASFQSRPSNCVSGGQADTSIAASEAGSPGSRIFDISSSLSNTVLNLPDLAVDCLDQRSGVTRSPKPLSPVLCGIEAQCRTADYSLCGDITVRGLVEECGPHPSFKALGSPSIEDTMPDTMPSVSVGSTLEQDTGLCDALFHRYRLQLGKSHHPMSSIRSSIEEHTLQRVAANKRSPGNIEQEANVLSHQLAVIDTALSQVMVQISSSKQSLRSAPASVGDKPLQPSHCAARKPSPYTSSDLAGDFAARVSGAASELAHSAALHSDAAFAVSDTAPGQATACSDVLPMSSQHSRVSPGGSDPKSVSKAASNASSPTPISRGGLLCAAKKFAASIKRQMSVGSTVRARGFRRNRRSPDTSGPLPTYNPPVLQPPTRGDRSQLNGCLQVGQTALDDVESGYLSDAPSDGVLVVATPCVSLPATEKSHVICEPHAPVPETSGSSASAKAWRTQASGLRHYR